jgi:hypothetical protein
VRDVTKQHVAGVVSERVVQLLEAVEVGDQQPERLSAAATALEHRVEGGVQPAAVGQTGQVVGGGVALHPGQQAYLAQSHGVAGRSGQHRERGEHERRPAERGEVAVDQQAEGDQDRERGERERGEALGSQHDHPAGHVPGGERHEGGCGQPQRGEERALDVGHRG